MIRINLLPVRAVQKKEKLRGQIVVFVLCMILVFVGCGGVYMSLSIKIDDQKADIAHKRQEIARLKKAIGEVGRFKALQKELRGKLEILDKLKANRAGPVRLLDELNRSLPPKLWLTKFNEKGGRIAIEGVGLSEETVAQFMRSLDLSPFYQNVQLNVIERKNEDGMKLQRFSLSAGAETPKN